MLPTQGLMRKPAFPSNMNQRMMMRICLAQQRQSIEWEHRNEQINIPNFVASTADLS